MRGLVGAGVAALVGGIVWGVIAIVTDYELGFIATGIGLLTGYATAGLARAKGLTLQLIAVGAALAGIVIGKYLTFFSVLREYVGTEHGLAAADTVSVFDPEVVLVFFQSLGEILTAYDLLWVALAVLAAWRIPRPLGIPLPDAS